MAKDMNPKNGFVKLFTLGKKFNKKTFSDNLKRYLLEFIGLFAAVTFSFYVESVGDEYEKKERYKEIVSTIPSKIEKSIQYSEEFLELSNEIVSTNNKIVENWEVDQDSIFIAQYEDIEYYSPLAYFFLIQEYSPPLLNFELFKSGDQEFKMLYKKVSDEINQLIDGSNLTNIVGLVKEEKKLGNKYKDLIYQDLGTNYDISSIFKADFWVKNRRGIQQNYKLKYLVKERIRLLKDLTNPQVLNYKSFLEEKLIFFDSINRSFENEKYVLYWKIN